MYFKEKMVFRKQVVKETLGYVIVEYIFIYIYIAFLYTNFEILLHSLNALFFTR